MVKFMSQDRVVIFGGNGYLGGELAKQLVSRNCNVIVADLNYSLGLPGITFAKVDITNPTQVKAVIEPGDIVVNFAGIADLNKAREQPRECIEVNIAGNNNILQACVERGVKKIGYASSAYVYSTHGSFYRISKRTCEEYILEYNKKYSIPYLLLRYGSLYGGNSHPSNGMHKILMQAMSEGKLSYDGNPSDSREFIHVSDASEITADLLLGSEHDKAFLLTGLERFTMAELFSLVEEILNKKLDIEFSCSSNSDHYKITQYNFSPIQAKRISKLAHVDLGNGIMELVNTLFIKNLKE
jgi:UDP-glucose 4-epimerase